MAEKPIIVTETTTYVFSDYEKKWIYLCPFKPDTWSKWALFSKISLATPTAMPYYRSVKTISRDILQSTEMELNN